MLNVDLEEYESLHQPEEGVELAELRPPDPVAGEELGGGQREVEAAEEEVRHGEVDDEDGCGVAHLSHAPGHLSYFDTLDHLDARIKAFLTGVKLCHNRDLQSKV